MNKWILFISIGLAILGAFLILDASSISSVLRYHNASPYYFFRKQLIMIVIGIVGSLIVLRFPTSTYKTISLGISLIMLAIMIFTFGWSKITGSISTVTMTIGPITFQPAEVLKVSLIMYMGSYYGQWANSNNKSWFSAIRPLILCAVCAGVILLGGDFGTCAIMAALYALVFVCVPTKEPWIKTFKGIVIFLLIFSVCILKFGYLVLPESALAGGGRLSRFNYKNACDRYEDPSGYQVCNGYIAMDNGGLTGVGVGNSVQKYLYLPESHTDFIFPIVVEEFGVLVGILIIIAYMVLLYFTFRVAVNTHTLRNSIICYGIGIYFMLHIFINLGGVLGIIPVTGVPLPFLSYGGTFIICMLGAFAIVQRINMENQIHKESN